MQHKPNASQVIAILILIATAPLHAATVTWINTSGGNWGTPANWSPNHVPGVNDTASITTPGSYTIQVDVNVTNGSLVLGASSGAQILTNNSETMIFLAGATIHTNGIMGLSGGTFSGPTTIQGVFDWAGGILYSNINVSVSGALNLSGSGYNLTSPLTNAGTVNWTGGYITINNNHGVFNSVIENQAGALFNVACDQGVNAGGYGFEYFHNAGLVQKTANADSTSFTLPFTNSGTIDSESGTINFSGVGNLDGNYTAGAGATVQFNGGTFVQSGNVTVSGLGTCQQNGATITYTSRIIKFLLTGGNVLLSPSFQGGAIQDLQLNGAYLLGTNRVTGSLGFSGGGVGQAAPLTVAPGAILNFNGLGVNIDSPITNQGTINWTAGTLEINNSHTTLTGAIYNQSTGLFSIQCDQYLTVGGYGYEFFKNSGLVQKVAGVGATTISLPFTNSGTVDAESGTIRFVSNGNLDGDYNTAEGSTIEFDGGQYTQSGVVNITGEGVCQQNGATVTITNQIPNLLLGNGNVTLSRNFENNGAIQNLELNGAYLLGTNVVTGVLTLSGGGIAGSSPLHIASGGTFNVVGLSININAPLTNDGTVNWMGSANIEINNSHTSLTGAFYNQPDGLLSIQNDQVLTIGGYGFEFFTNAGTVRKLGGIGATTFSIPFTNAGTVDCESGSIRFADGGNLGGTYNTVTNSTTSFVSGTFWENSPVLLTGPGLCEQYGGNVVLNNQIFGLLLASGNVSLTPVFQGSGSIHSLQISGATLLGTNVVNGILKFDGGTIPSAAPLIVAPGGTLDIEGPAGLTVNSPVTNYGTINWTGGGIGINNNFTTVTGLFENEPAGLLNIETDQSMSSGGYGFESFRNDGVIRKTAGLATTYFQVPFQNFGTLDVQSGGAIQFTTAYTQTGGFLNIGINSLASYGHITFNDGLALTGSIGLNFNGSYFPNVGDSFTPLNYPLHSGFFTNVAFPTGITWLTNYGATAFSVSVATAPTYGIRIAQVMGRTISPGDLFAVTNTTVDYDPANKVTFGLSASPSGATINSSTGVLQWQAPGVDINSSNYFTVTATDNGVPPASGSMSFAVLVSAPNTLDLSIVSLLSGTATMQITGGVGTTNILQASTNLIDWTSLSTNKPSTSPFTVLDTNAGHFHTRFYRDLIP